MSKTPAPSGARPPESAVSAKPSPARSRSAAGRPPRIRTTTVGSYPYPAWLAALPSEQTLMDATRVVVDIQRQAGIDLPTDGELYRFDVNHPDTNGMIDSFLAPMDGIDVHPTRADVERFRAFFHAMLDRGVYLAPSAFEAGFVSAAHDGATLERTLEAAAEAIRATLQLWPHRSMTNRGFAVFMGATFSLICLPMLAVLGTLRPRQ